MTLREDFIDAEKINNVILVEHCSEKPDILFVDQLHLVKIGRQTFGRLIETVATDKSCIGYNDSNPCVCVHDNVITWKHFPRYWPYVRGIHRSPVKSPLKGQWRGALMLQLICAWTKGWVNSREPGDLRCYCAHYDVTLMVFSRPDWLKQTLRMKAYSICSDPPPDSFGLDFIHLCWKSWPARYSHIIHKICTILYQFRPNQSEMAIKILSNINDPHYPFHCPKWTLTQNKTQT